MQIIQKIMVAIFIFGMTLVGGGSTSYAQDWQCGTTLSPAQEAALREEAQQKAAQLGSGGRLSSDCSSIYDCPERSFTIPVVFHVVRQFPDASKGIVGDPEISDAAVLEALKQLKQYFEGTHPRHSAIDPEFVSVFAGDTDIKFVLAATDPWGNPHSGITRHRTTIEYFFHEDLDTAGAATGTEIWGYPFHSVKKRTSAAAWPHDQYLNVWICDLATLSGYATFPDDDLIKPQYSGVVLDQNILLNPEEQLSAFAHEAGHWCGLLHTFPADTLLNICNYGCGYTTIDFCEDTPPDILVTPRPCGSNACPDDLPNSMDQNLMDYSPTACLRMFTEDQADRMGCILTNKRTTLGAGCVAELSSPNVVISPPEPLMCLGDNKTFTAAFYTDVDYEWQVLPAGVCSISTPTPENILTITVTNPTYKGLVTVRLRLKSNPDPTSGTMSCGVSRWFEYKVWVGGLVTTPQIRLVSGGLNIGTLGGPSFILACQSRTSLLRAEIDPTYPTELLSSLTYTWEVVGGTLEWTSGNEAMVRWTLGTSPMPSGLVRVRVSNDCSLGPLGARPWTYGCSSPITGGRLASISPNPTSQNTVKVELEKEVALAPEGLQISIKDLLGIERLHFTNIQSRVAELDISSLQSGAYVVHIQNGQQSEQLRLVVE